MRSTSRRRRGLGTRWPAARACGLLRFETGSRLSKDDRPAEPPNEEASECDGLGAGTEIGRGRPGKGGPVREAGYGDRGTAILCLGRAGAQDRLALSWRASRNPCRSRESRRRNGRRKGVSIAIDEGAWRRFERDATEVRTGADFCPKLVLKWPQLRAATLPDRSFEGRSTHHSALRPSSRRGR
ncbi:hypothetical protein SCOR_28260 [Sulfidibacter corallicola]